LACISLHKKLTARTAAVFTRSNVVLVSFKTRTLQNEFALRDRKYQSRREVLIYVMYRMYNNNK